MSDPPRLGLRDTNAARAEMNQVRKERVSCTCVSEKQSYLHIQTTTPVRQTPGLRSNSVRLSASGRKGLLTQHGIQGSDPGPESPATSGGHKPSGGAELQGRSQIKYI